MAPDDLEYEFAEQLVARWQQADDDRSLSEFMLLDPEEYAAYVREDALPDDFVARHTERGA